LESQGSGEKCKLPPDYYAACKRICAKLILYLLAAPLLILLPFIWHRATNSAFSLSPRKQLGGGVITEAHEESYLKKKNAEKKGG